MTTVELVRVRDFAAETTLAEVFVEIRRVGRKPVSLPLESYLDLSAEDLAETTLCLWLRQRDGSRRWLSGWDELCAVLARSNAEARS